MFAGFERLPVQMLMLLHVGEVDEEIERFAREHLVNVRVVMRDLELLRLVARALRSDVAQADHLDVRARGEHRQVRMRHTAAPNHPGADAFCLFAQGGHYAGRDRSAGQDSCFREVTTVQTMR